MSEKEIHQDQPYALTVADAFKRDAKALYPNDVGISTAAEATALHSIAASIFEWRSASGGRCLSFVASAPTSACSLLHFHFCHGVRWCRAHRARRILSQRRARSRSISTGGWTLRESG